jgi:hypothetical protein
MPNFMRRQRDGIATTRKQNATEKGAASTTAPFSRVGLKLSDQSQRAVFGRRSSATSPRYEHIGGRQHE